MKLCCLSVWQSLRNSVSLIPMTHAPETGAINRFHFLTPVFGAGFWHHARLETGMKISGAENKQGRKVAAKTTYNKYKNNQIFNMTIYSPQLTGN